MIAITGVTGFVGSCLGRALSQTGAPWVGISRRHGAFPAKLVSNFDDISTLTATLADTETIFHCAGYAHAFSSLSGSDSCLHWKVNFEGTRNLVEAAGRAGARRFIFLSSVKAMAEPGDICADEDWPGEPDTAYGQAKRAAEQAVLDAGARYGMHVVNLRPAMVYGAGGRGNLERMARLVARGLFPPLPETGNRRSLVHVSDVVAAMQRVAEDERAAGRTYIVASNEAPSGRMLFDALRAVQGMPRCGWHVPASVLRLAGKVGDGVQRLAHRRMPLDSEVVDRLLGSAWYSPARIERELGWSARMTLVDGLREMLGK